MAMAGKITGKHKQLDKGRQVFAFAAGTQKLYDYMWTATRTSWARRSITRTMFTSSRRSTTSFPSTMPSTAISSGGQRRIAGIKHISGTGGQLDFAMGAYLSKGGKSFIMSSTVTGKDGTVKPHRSTLTPGSICRSALLHALYRHRVRHGQPRGLSTWERAEAR